MFVPTDTNFIELSSLIGPPYNYWGDDDGDGQGVNGVTATGSLRLSIVDKRGRAVARDDVLTTCIAPYKLTLSNTEGTLKTRYGVPNESRFRAGNATYYINPKVSPLICAARPLLMGQGLIHTIYDSSRGFIPQLVYDSNFPTTGADKLYFDLIIDGTNQALSWAPVSHGGITATMTNSTRNSVRVTLTGPVAIPSQQQTDNPGEIDRPSLPQLFELVGRDSSGNTVIKYGFKLKQWFINRGIGYPRDYSSLSSWCNNIGYRLPTVSDLTNASCRNDNSDFCRNYANEFVGATPSSPNRYGRRYIDAGLFSEWGDVNSYLINSPPYIDPNILGYWTQDRVGSSQASFVVDGGGKLDLSNWEYSGYGICTYP